VNVIILISGIFNLHFTVSAAYLIGMKSNHSVQYADNILLYISLSPRVQSSKVKLRVSLSSVQKCAYNIMFWMVKQ